MRSTRLKAHRKEIYDILVPEFTTTNGVLYFRQVNDVFQFIFSEKTSSRLRLFFSICPICYEFTTFSYFPYTFECANSFSHEKNTLELTSSDQIFLLKNNLKPWMLQYTNAVSSLDAIRSIIDFKAQNGMLPFPLHQVLLQAGFYFHLQMNAWDDALQYGETFISWWKKVSPQNSHFTAKIKEFLPLLKAGQIEDVCKMRQANVENNLQLLAKEFPRAKIILP